MPTDANADAEAPRPKRQWGPVLLTAALLMIVTGSVAFFLLGREDPRDVATADLAWGDRVERRLDALIDNAKPAWADSLEARLEKFAERIGWD